MTPIPVYLAVEDVLSETVMRTLLAQSGRNYVVGAVYGRQGFGYLKKRASGFNRASVGTPFIMLTDLDEIECASILIRDWMTEQRNDNFLFRVAVREVEAWILAHREAFAAFLGIPVDNMPNHPDVLSDPKAELLRLVNHSRRRDIREDIVPPSGSLRKQGPGYNSRLEEFVLKSWNATEAAKYSPSLARSFNRLKTFEPVWGDTVQEFHHE